MKNIIFFFLLFLISCHNNDRIGMAGDDKIIFPTKYDSARFENILKKTKWMIYCSECDKRCILSSAAPIKDSTYFGFLDLKFRNVKYFHDTTQINMDFYYNDTIKCDINTVDHLGTLLTGAFFVKGSDDPIYFDDGSNIFFFINTLPPSNRQVNPLQPEVINFIRKNKEKLNSWFREEARQKGVLDSSSR